MGRPRKKKEYNPDMEVMREITDIVLYFGEPYDDCEPVAKDHVSLREAADHFGITILKARKMLITAGVYSTYNSRRVQELYNVGLSEEKIVQMTGLSRASVNSYIPYKRIVYNLPVLSVDADRKKKQRIRELACKRFIELMPDYPDEVIEKELWKLLELHEGCIFHTVKGIKFRYKVRGNKLIIDRRKNGITRSTVIVAWWNWVKLDRNVEEPKRLVADANYLYPIFARFLGKVK